MGERRRVNVVFFCTPRNKTLIKLGMFLYFYKKE
nr:MAG TPA: hypothetical protein [Caudoviricetes sp.]